VVRPGGGGANTSSGRFVSSSASVPFGIFAELNIKPISGKIVVLSGVIWWAQ
jgi:hypothetical protein